MFRWKNRASYEDSNRECLANENRKTSLPGFTGGKTGSKRVIYHWIPLPSNNGVWFGRVMDIP